MFHYNWVFDTRLALEGESTTYRLAVLNGKVGAGVETGLRRTYTLNKLAPPEDQEIGEEAEPEQEPEEVVEEPTEAPIEETPEPAEEVPPTEPPAEESLVEVDPLSPAAGGGAPTADVVAA